MSADRLELCVAYTGARPNTGMVLVKVELLTVWRAVSPERLTNQVEALVHDYNNTDQMTRTFKHPQSDRKKP